MKSAWCVQRVKTKRSGFMTKQTMLYIVLYGYETGPETLVKVSDSIFDCVIFSIANATK